MTFTQRICGTCGTEIVRDEETWAEAHLDTTFRNCGVEGELNRLANHIEGAASPARLRVVK